MLALTGWQPWFWAIAEGFKLIENRPWSPPADVVGKVIAIHGGKHWDERGADAMAEHLGMDILPNAANHTGIIAVATVRGVVRTARDAEDLIPGQGRWFTGPVGWVLGDVRKLSRPIAVLGAQKLWKLTPEAERLIAADLARVG